MNLTGEVFCALDVESDYRVTDAIVTPHRISIDWEEDDVKAHLDTTSRDGIHFKGNYGYRTKHSDFEFELTLFKSKQEYLLFGTWCEHDTGDEGIWVFRLHKKEAKPRKGAAATKPRQTPVRSVRKDSSSTKPSSSISRRAARAVADRSSVRSAQNGKKASAPATEPPRVRRPEMCRTAAPATKIPAPSPPPSAQLDHLLQITPNQFDELDRLKLTAELNAAPLSAVFKLAHNAKAPAVRSEAAKAYTNRYKVAAPQNSPQQEVVTKKGTGMFGRKRSGRKK